MPFFQGAQDVKVNGGTMNDIAGNLTNYYDRRQNEYHGDIYNGQISGGQVGGRENKNTINTVTQPATQMVVESTQRIKDEIAVLKQQVEEAKQLAAQKAALQAELDEAKRLADQKAALRAELDELNKTSGN